MRNIKYSKVLLAILLCLPFMCMFQIENIYAEEAIPYSSEEERLLKWYEEHKDASENYNEFELKEDVYLDGGTREHPIQFDGTSQRMFINANNHTIYIRSNSELHGMGI